MGKRVAEDPADEPAEESEIEFGVSILPATLAASVTDALMDAARAVPERDTMIQAVMARMSDASDFLRVGGIDGVYDGIADATKGWLAQLEGLRNSYEAATASAANALASATFHELRLSDNMTRVLADVDFGVSDKMARALADVNFGLSDNMTRMLANTNFGLSDKMARALADVDFGVSDKMARALADANFGLSDNMRRWLADGLNLERGPLFGMSGPPFGHLAGGTEIVVPAANPVAQRLVELFRERVPRSDHLLIGDRYYRPAYPLSHADETADAPPDDAALLHVLRVARGNLTQLGNLFEYFFGPARSPDRCFIVRERGVGRWTIYQAEDTGRDARERARYANGVAGFIVGVDLPVVIVEVYGVAERDRPRIASFAMQLQERIKAVGFRLETADRIDFGQWSGTGAKIEKLKEVRNSHRNHSERRITIGRKTACEFADIDMKTAKKHAPELYARWEEWDY